MHVRSRVYIYNQSEASDSLVLDQGGSVKSSMGMGYIVKLLNSARQTAVSASTSDSIQVALVSGRLVSHITYLWTPSDATGNFHGRGAALDLKRLSVHGLVRVLLDVKHLSMFRAFFLFFFFSWGWLADGHVPGAGRTQHPAGRHRWIRYVPVAWDARSVSNDGKLDQSRRPSISNGDGARSRILLICGSGIVALPRGNEINPEGLPGRRSRLRLGYWARNVRTMGPQQRIRVLQR